MKILIKKHKSKLLVITILLFSGIVGASAATVIFASSEVSFNNTTAGASGMSSTNVQDAIDEVYAEAGYCPHTIVEQMGLTLVTSGDGLYQDTYETNRYIYKGASPNNYIYIKENGTNVKYRIYSIEVDGTVKVIRDEAITSMNFDAFDATRRNTGYCTNSYCNAWAAMNSFTNGTMTGEVKGLNGNSGDSSIKEYIDGTYAQMIDTTKIVTKTWNISGTEYNRDTLANAIADEKKSTWDGKIALLTASEYVRANSNTASCETPKLLLNNYSTCGSTNYLANSSDWWLLSPSSVHSYVVLFAYSNSNISSYNANHSYGVRPVFYLCSDLTYSGKGTSSEPYEISGGSCSS